MVCSSDIFRKHQKIFPTPNFSELFTLVKVLKCLCEKAGSVTAGLLGTYYCSFRSARGNANCAHPRGSNHSLSTDIRSPAVTLASGQIVFESCLVLAFDCFCPTEASVRRLQLIHASVIPSYTMLR